MTPRLRPWLLVAASLLLVGPLTVGRPVRAQESGPLRIAFADPVSSLDPQLNNNAGDRSVDMFFFDLSNAANSVEVLVETIERLVGCRE